MTATDRPTDTEDGAAEDRLAEWRFTEASGRRRERRPAVSAREALRLTARELRVVLTVLFVVFVTGEAWQVFGRLSGLRYVVLLAAFGLLAVLLGALSSREQVASAVQDPRFERPVPSPARHMLARRLRLRTWFEILTVFLAVGAGFLALGVLVVGEDLTREWSALGDGLSPALLPLSEVGPGRVDSPVEIYDLGGGLVLSEPLLRVVGVLGAFAALLFAVEVLVDAETRADVTDDLVHEWTAAREAFEQAPGAADETRTRAQ